MSKKVLLVDDEKDLCMLISGYLNKRGCEVVCAYSIIEGMQKIEEFKPEILLIDNNLPDGLGWEEAGNIHRKFPDINIILLSGGEATIFSITANGLNFPRLEKPVSLSSLEQYVLAS